ncbi:hypothetical protein NXS19_005063 [Fusarium pseudograminearum]|nr:hypothetical protein NXS19_005063 [Fusarium pseudograminearum]
MFSRYRECRFGFRIFLRYVGNSFNLNNFTKALSISTITSQERPRPGSLPYILFSCALLLSRGLEASRPVSHATEHSPMLERYLMPTPAVAVIGDFEEGNRVFR